jgi:hypothetical protein
MGADRRIALVPSQYFDDKTVRSLVDQSLTDPWSVTLYGAPPADHFMPPENGFTTAGEVALVYQDDGNQTLDMSDLMWGINTICSDLGPVTMLYVPGPTDFSSAMMSVGVGMPSGWNIITTSGEEEEMNLLTETEFQSLEIDDDCTFED